MKRKRVIGVAAFVAGSVAACGGSGSSGSGSGGTTAQSLDTAQVLAQAQKSAEGSEPYAVNDGMLVLTDTSETSEPLSVNGT